MNLLQDNSYSNKAKKLPPLPAKIHKALQAKEYVDFNNLLPQSLYDIAQQQSTFYLQLNEDSPNTNTLALASNKKKAKITNFLGWLEAWNVFIRGMTYFHPHLAQELLSYQETICNMNKAYPFDTWLRFDIAFRMKTTITGLP